MTRVTILTSPIALGDLPPGVALTGSPVIFTATVAIGTAPLATSATDGFLYVPTCAGTPTGVPTTQTGTAALVYDTTAHKLWVYDSGWKGIGLS